MVKRNLILTVCGLFLVILLAGCSTPKAKEINVVSKVDCQITVPVDEEKQVPVYFHIPFYCLYTGTDRYGDLLASQHVFEIGKDAVLTGNHVDLLRGGTVTVSQVSVMEEIDKESYYSQLAQLYASCFKGLAGADESLQEEVKETAERYTKDGKLLCFDLTFDGEIKEDVSVTSLQIPTLNGFEISFDQLSLETVALPDNVDILPDDGVFEFTSFGGGSYGPVITKVEPTFVGGKVLQDLAGIRMVSLNDVCEVVTQENKGRFSDLELQYRAFDVPTPAGYSTGNTVELDYTFVMKDEKAVLDMQDTRMASFARVFELENGEVYWSVSYEPIARDGAFLMLHVLDEELGSKTK